MKRRVIDAHEMQVELSNYGFGDSKYSCGNKRWAAETLVEAAEGLPVFRLPLIAIDLGVNPWVCENIREYAEHFKRVQEADLKYPVIIDEYGYIVDGWHRVVKALVLGKRTIKAKRLEYMPEPDEIVSN